MGTELSQINHSKQSSKEMQGLIHSKQRCRKTGDYPLEAGQNCRVLRNLYGMLRISYKILDLSKGNTNFKSK